MQLTFGTMTSELNIFYLSNKHKQMENDNQGTDEVCSVDPNAEKPKAPTLQEKLVSQGKVIDWELSASVTLAESIISPKSSNAVAQALPGSRGSSSLTPHE